MANVKPDKKNMSSKSSPVFVIVVVGILVVGLAAIAFLATRGDDSLVETDDTSETGSATAISIDESVGPVEPVQIVGEALPQVPAEGADPAVGLELPALTGTTFEGSSLTIAADGKPKAIYFLAHWCPHCQDEVPVVQQLIDEGKKPDSLDVYAVSTAVDEGKGNFPPSKWLADEGFTPEVIYDDAENQALQEFGGAGFPYVIYVDADNKVTSRSSSLPAEEILLRWQDAAG